jgi:2-methylcitrate dehydratase PrpD
MADRSGATLDEVLDAGIAGYDAMCQLGEELDPPTVYASGFHPTGVCGPIGAAVGVARLLGLDDATTTRAMLLATSMSGGLLTFLDGGGATKPLQAGHSAAAGIQAALLAADGYAGPDEEAGMRRFRAAFGDGAELGSRGDRDPGHGVRETSIKLYSSCRYMHGCIDLLLEAAIPTERIERVECAVLRGGWDLVADPIEAKRRPASSVEAQFSMPFGAAAAIALGGLTLDDIDRAATLAPSLHDLMDRVECVHDAALDEAYPAQWGAAVRIVTRDGETLERREDAFLGSAGNPASLEVVQAKLEALAGEDWTRAATEIVHRPDAADLASVRWFAHDGHLS